MTKKTASLYVLLVEDQRNIARNIADYMEEKGHIFDFATPVSYTHLTLPTNREV